MGLYQPSSPWYGLDSVLVIEIHTKMLSFSQPTDCPPLHVVFGVSLFAQCIMVLMF
jgi:hypothetical protein